MKLPLLLSADGVEIAISRRFRTARFDPTVVTDRDGQGSDLRVRTATLELVLPGIGREIGQVPLHRHPFLRVTDRFQIFLELGCFCIRLTLRLIDLS